MRAPALWTIPQAWYRRKPEKAQFAISLTLLILMVLGLTVTIVLANTTPTRKSWSDTAPSWIGVFAAIGAAIIGAFVFKRDRDRDIRLENRLRQEQASLVSAWVGKTDADTWGLRQGRIGVLGVLIGEVGQPGDGC